MFLIVGLGNIGVKYNHTRHNIGFDFIDLVSRKYNIDLNREKFKGTCGEGFIGQNKVILLKPSTYMNLSGESVIEAVNYYKIKNDHVIIIYDDINIDIGRFRIRTHGSAGGHNGIKNIILNLGTDIFPRIKIGAGYPDIDIVSYVLKKFSKEQRVNIEKILQIAVEALDCMVNFNVEAAMNKFNGFIL